jgi:hypothetical protein
MAELALTKCDFGQTFLLRKLAFPARAQLAFGTNLFIADKLFFVPTAFVGEVKSLSQQPRKSLIYRPAKTDFQKQVCPKSQPHSR